MTTEAKGFWSSTSGVLTGAAGVLTGVVGLLTVLVQLDVIGGEGQQSSTTPKHVEREVDPTATTSRAGATTHLRSATPTRSSRSSSGVSTQPSFEVDPETVEFAGPLGDEQVVTVRNRGREGFYLEEPGIRGPDAQRFDVKDSSCGGAELDPGGDCQVTLGYRPDTAAESQATLVVAIAESEEAIEVPLRGERLL